MTDCMVTVLGNPSRQPVAARTNDGSFPRGIHVSHEYPICIVEGTREIVKK